MNPKIALILSCEHAVNHIPADYEKLFADYKELLYTHRGIDFGALELAQQLQKALNIPLVQAQASRLLIDCNRSLNNPNCFSAITKMLNPTDKKRIIEDFYLPYRNQLIDYIDKYIAEGNKVVHLSIHSFTPILDGIERNADLAFLYDPKQKQEKFICQASKKWINEVTPEYRIRMNYPYKGTSDGFTSCLRKHYTRGEYSGIEIEINQRISRVPNILNALGKILTINFQKMIT